MLIFRTFHPPTTTTTIIKKKKYTQKNNIPPIRDGIKPMRSVEGSDNEQKSTLSLPHKHTVTHTRCKLNVSHSPSLFTLWSDVGGEREGEDGGETSPLLQSIEGLQTLRHVAPRTKQVHPTHE